jgi:glyoxylase-like metal-dependent hydrolase (beta-lactamase superfamily II)
MHEEIKTISLLLPDHLGSVNCYLINTLVGFILVDTGYPRIRAELERQLEDAGCRPGSLLPIIITHGDGDHSGNAKYLREKFGWKVAIHPLEAAIVEYGDSTQSRTRSRFQRVLDPIVLALFSVFFNLGKPEKFKPDLLVGEGFDIAPFGWSARLIHLPGHSRGSIGILSAKGELFCGDLLWNRNKPGPQSIMVDNKVDFKASLGKLSQLNITTVYPGHGAPFSMELVRSSYNKSV